MRSHPHCEWRPPSDILTFDRGLWKTAQPTKIGYPDDGNELCFQVEPSSFWFTHRLNLIREGIRLLPPTGPFLDVGGGNGFVARALQDDGVDVTLLEPGPGARNALARGLHRVIQGSLEDTAIYASSFGSAGAFDVLEHIPDDAAFLRLLRSKLRVDGRFYGTVPAYATLWSEADVQAGHVRRYTEQNLRQTLTSSGFTVEFITGCFTWLIVPILVMRALPWKLDRRRAVTPMTFAQVQHEHRLPRWLGGPVRAAHAWECARVRRRQPISIGTSLFFIARSTHVCYPS